MRMGGRINANMHLKGDSKRKDKRNEMQIAGKIEYMPASAALRKFELVRTVIRFASESPFELLGVVLGVKPKSEDCIWTGLTYGPK